MRLTEVTVANYRSITAQTKFAVGDLTTLVGPNNEGKSNLLRAMALGMEIIHRWSSLNESKVKAGEVSGVDALVFLRAGRQGNGSNLANTYRWSQDFPLSKQDRSGSRPTLIKLKFHLDPAEVEQFRNETGMYNNGDLPVEITLGRQSVTFAISKPGKGAATHKAKSKEVAKFIDSRISLISVPAIRTGEQAMGLVNDLARFRTSNVTRSEEYRELVARLNALRQQAVDAVARDLSESVRRYIPSVMSVHLDSADVADSNSIGSLLIDDGTQTPIEHKGDGIKSLVTMALIQELAQLRSASHSFLLAVDEPEAHLHPGAVHELQALFQELSDSQQVILATHNPIFVNRENVSSNILVRANAALPAKNMPAVRSTLGVVLADNLESAETVVLVEGVTDEKVLPAILGRVDPEVGKLVRSHRVVFRATKGAGKLRTQIQREKSSVCRILVVLDGDEAGRSEARLIGDSSLLPISNIFLLGGDQQERELEDLIRPECYLESLSERFNRKFTESHFKNASRKWSKNLVSAASQLGISEPLDELVDAAKMVVSAAVQECDETPWKPQSLNHLESLAALVVNV